MNQQKNPAQVDSISFEQRWRQRFRQFAEQEADAAIAGWSETGLQARVRHFHRLFKTHTPAALWLDAGCGAGTYTRYLANAEQNVIGLDYSWPSIAKARARDTRPGLWGVANICALPFKPASFDGVLCFGVTQALGDSAAAITELAAALKPKGELWIDALNGWCLPHLIEQLRRKIKGKPLHVRYESPRKLKKLLQAAGLQNIQRHWLPILPARWQRFQWLVETRFVIALLHHLPFIGALFSHAVVFRGTRV